MRTTIMRFGMVTVAVVALLQLSAAAANAQAIVRGRLLDAESGAVVGGGFVKLMDGSGRPVAQMLSDAAGRYQLTAPAGSYSLRVERLGYGTYETPSFRLDSVLVRDLTLPQIAIELPPIVSTTDRQCDTNTARAAAAAAVWEEVRKALSIASWTTAQANIHYTIETSRQTLDKGNHAVRHEVKDISSGHLSGSPFAAINPKSLLKDGFIQTNKSGFSEYYGPDAELILSDEFQQTHCFSAVVDAKQPGMVGLAFEPGGSIKPTDVRGVLWIDRKTYELKRLEFSYNKLPVNAPESTAGGAIDFARLETGMWIVSGWTIKAPMMSTLSGKGSTRVVGAIQRVSQTVLSADINGRIVYPPAPAR